MGFEEREKEELTEKFQDLTDRKHEIRIKNAMERLATDFRNAGDNPFYNERDSFFINMSAESLEETRDKEAATEKIMDEYNKAFSNDKMTDEFYRLTYEKRLSEGTVPPTNFESHIRIEDNILNYLKKEEFAKSKEELEKEAILNDIAENSYDNEEEGVLNKLKSFFKKGKSTEKEIERPKTGETYKEKLEREKIEAFEREYKESRVKEIKAERTKEKLNDVRMQEKTNDKKLTKETELSM